MYNYLLPAHRLLPFDPALQDREQYFRSRPLYASNSFPQVRQVNERVLFRPGVTGCLFHQLIRHLSEQYFLPR